MAFIKQIKVGNNTYDIHKKVTVTIAAADWTAATIDKTVSGMTVNDIVVVSPAPSSITGARNSVVYCSAIKANALSFTYSVSKPTTALTFNVLWVQAATTDTDKGAIINTVMGGKIPTGTLNVNSTLSNYDTYLNNVRYINLGAGSLNVSGSAISSVSGSGSVNPGANTISKNSATNVSTGTITTTKPTSGVYVAVDAATAQGSGNINISASGTARAGVTTAGYVHNETASSNISKSGTASVTVPAKSAATTYIPITSTNVVEKAGSVSGNTYTQGKVTVDTAGYISAGDKVSGASFANTATTNVTYKDISGTTAAPILVSNDYLYINKGYTDNVKISLAKLVPDGASADLASNKILSGYSAYDNDGKLIAGSIPTITPAFGGGGLSGNNIGGSQNKGLVTISESGTFFADAAKTNFGVTTTKPSGTDGTNYLTIHEAHSTDSDTATGSTTITRGAVVYNGAATGYINKANNTQALASGSKTVSASITVTPRVTDNFEPHYIPVSSASASATAGFATATAGTTSVSGLTEGTYQTTATSGYTYKITATGGSASATGGSASASVSKGVTAGANKSASGLDTGTKTGSSSTIYLVKAAVTNNTSGGTSSGTINVGKQIKISAGYNPSDLYYTAQTSAAGASGNVTCNAQSGNNVAGYATASVKTGSAKTPATTISHTVSVKWDDNKGWIATAPATTKSVTPTVSAGWVASGTAGTITLPETSVNLGSSAWSSATAPSGVTPTTLAKGTTYKMTAGYSNVDRYYTTQSDPTLSGNAAAANVLSSKTFYSDSYTKHTGTMANNGSTGGTISTKAGTVSIPAGYTTGGSVSISTAEQNKIVAGNIKKGVTVLGVAGTYTNDATATAANILSNKTAYVDGAKISGTMTDRGAVAPTALNPGGSYAIPAGYHNGNGKVTARALNNQAKSPTEITVGTAITPDSGRDGLSSVTIPNNATIIVGEENKLSKENKLNIIVPHMSSSVVNYDSLDNEGGANTQLNATVGGGTLNTINVSDEATTNVNVYGMSILNINRVSGTVHSDDLIASNIRKGSSILGVVGTYAASSTASDIYKAQYAGNISSSGWSTYWYSFEGNMVSNWDFTENLSTPIPKGASVRLKYNEFGPNFNSGAGFRVSLVSASGTEQIIASPSAYTAVNGPHTSSEITSNFAATKIKVEKFSAGGGETVYMYQSLAVEVYVNVPSGYYGVTAASGGSILADVSSYQYMAVKKATLGDTYTPSTSKQYVHVSGEGWVKTSDTVATIKPIPTETQTVTLSLASGNQTVHANSGKYMTSVTINKPSTLVAGNIKNGVNIAGVTGTYEGGSSTSTFPIYIRNASGVLLHTLEIPQIEWGTKWGEYIAAQTGHHISWGTGDDAYNLEVGGEIIDPATSNNGVWDTMSGKYLYSGRNNKEIGITGLMVMGPGDYYLR